MLWGEDSEAGSEEDDSSIEHIYEAQTTKLLIVAPAKLGNERDQLIRAIEMEKRAVRIGKRDGSRVAQGWKLRCLCSATYQAAWRATDGFYTTYSWAETTERRLPEN
jgi:hypothetical protein